MVSNADLNFSSFIHGDHKEKFKQHDLLTDINREHPKVMQILRARINHMKPILHWWNSANYRSAVNAISSLQEPTILQDALQMLMFSPKFGTMGMELLPPMIEKSKVLIGSKYLVPHP
jgi:katanin p80 WD40 repeat-containing subunit B1